MKPLPRSKRRDQAREGYVEPRPGLVLRELRPSEVIQAGHELATRLNERARLEDDKRLQASIFADKIKAITSDIVQLQDEVEFKLAWVPAQQQMEGLFGDHGLLPESNAQIITEIRERVGRVNKAIDNKAIDKKGSGKSEGPTKLTVTTMDGKKVDVVKVNRGGKKKATAKKTGKKAAAKKSKAKLTIVPPVKK